MQYSESMETSIKSMVFPFEEEANKGLFYSVWSETKLSDELNNVFVISLYLYRKKSNL